MANSASIQKMSVNHDAILDYMMANPTVQKGAVAVHFGVTRSWLSIIINSDAFLEAKAKRNDEFFGASIVPLREKMVGIVDASLDKLSESVEVMESAMALETADTLLHRLGYAPNTKQNGGAAAQGVVAQQNNYFVNADTLERARGNFGKPVNGEVVESTQQEINHVPSTST
jgi:hypothetical protein